jgi:hypothetical protein
MTIKYNPFALKAVTLIADLCSEYDRNESTDLLINLIKAFQSKDLNSLSTSQLNKTFHFINKLTNIYLSIQQINTDYESEEEEEWQKNAQQMPDNLLDIAATQQDPDSLLKANHL